jgi:peptidyl-tRNA hydrolase, PTH1 family
MITKEEEKTFILVGLGNYGKKYDTTPHNIGKESLLLFAEKGECVWKKDALCDVLYTKKTMKDKEGCIFTVILVIPSTYMNLSGLPISCFLERFKKKNPLLCIVHDDIDLPLFTLRFVFNRGNGGHKGVENIMHHLKTRSFYRLRIGVIPQREDGTLKKPRAGRSIVRFVLGIKKKEKDTYEEVKKNVVDALDVFLKKDFEKAVAEVHGKNKKK